MTMHEEHFKHIQAFAFSAFPNGSVCVHTGAQRGLLHLINTLLGAQEPLQA